MMLALVTVGFRTTGAHPAIKWHAGVVSCVGQPEASGVDPSHSALTPNSVDFALDSTAEWSVADTEPTEVVIDISL
jgi:hypothetical protein